MTDPLGPLRDRFRARAASELLELQDVSDADLSSQTLHRLAHNLAGAAGTFGYAELSQAAMELDDQMSSTGVAAPASLERLREQLRAATSVTANRGTPA